MKRTAVRKNKKWMIRIRGLAGDVKDKSSENGGDGEFVSFAVIALLIGVLMVTMIAFVQYTANINALNSALSVISRTVALADSFDEAVENAELVADSVIITSNFLNNVSTSVEYLNSSTPAGTWDSGTRVVVTVSAQFHTSAPFISGTRKCSAIVSVEKVMGGLLRGMLATRVTRYGTLGITYPMTSGFGLRDSVKGSNGFAISSNHLGLDFGMSVGTELIAPATGKVVFVGYGDAARGTWIVMYVGQGIYVLYQHLSSIAQGIRVGSYVNYGDTVAYSGMSGNVTGAHLHLEILYSTDGRDSITNFYDTSTRVDPYTFVFG